MTHEMFWELFDSGKISVKVWAGTVDGVEKSVEAFEFGGKFFLRLHSSEKYVKRVTGAKGYDKKLRLSRDWNVIREFDCREKANAYFKKFAVGLDRVDC